jgi:hypothetical protein
MTQLKKSRKAPQHPATSCGTRISRSPHLGSGDDEFDWLDGLRPLSTDEAASPYGT